MRRVESLLAVLSILPGLALAQNGSVRGRVTDATGAPLSRATISAEAAGLRATSDEQGRYEIRGVAAGTYTVRVRLLGYVPQSVKVTVGQSAVTQDFRLAEQAISLSPVDVVVGSRARHTAAEQLAVPVDIFTAEDLTKQGVTETGQILQSLAPSINFPHQSVRRDRHRAAVPSADSRLTRRSCWLTAGAVIKPRSSTRLRTAPARARAASISTPFRRARSIASMCCATALRRSTAPTRSPAW